MESNVKLLGHPVHPMLIVFPVGLLVTSVVFDLLYLVTGNDVIPVVSFYNISGGIIGGALAAIFGFLDYRTIPGETRARRIGLWHGLGNVVVLLLFSFSWAVRRSSEGFTPDIVSLLASFLGIGVASMTAWMGGELVDRLGVGVDSGANLNAPSSLTTESTRPMTAEQIPVTGETRELDREPAVPVKSEEVPGPREGDEKTGKIIDEP